DVLAEHEPAFDLVVDAGVLEGGLRGAAVGREPRVGDRDLVHARVGGRAEAERIEIERRAVRHPDDEMTYGVAKLRLRDRPALLDELMGEIDVGGEEEIERRLA